MVDLETPINVYCTKEDNDEYLTELKSDELLRKLTEICDIIGGEDAIVRFTYKELIDMLKEMSTSHEEYTNLQECKEAEEAHEFYHQGGLCDV